MFNRLLRRTNDTTTAPMDVDPQTTLNVLVHGDPSSGKSALIEKFLDPSKTIRATADDQNDYWNFSSTQGPSFFDYNGIKVRFEEVPGSRGRMSNYHSLVRANDVADAIIYCVSAGHNSYNYYGTLAENINGGLSTMDRINGMYDVKGKKSASAPTTEKKEKTKSAKLSFAVVTMIDQPERSVVDRSAINVEDVLVYETSAVTGEGVQSTLLDIIQQAIERTEKGKKLSREAGVTLAQLQEDKKKRVELDQAQHSSVKASGLLSKFTSFFKGAVRAPAVAVEAKTITPTNAVADLAVSA